MDAVSFLKEELIYFMSRNRWIFAKTMRDQPHWYFVKHRLDAADQQLFVQLVIDIREFGIKEKYRGRYYTVLYYDIWKMWTMGDTLPNTYILNLCHKDQLGPDKVDPNQYDFIKTMKAERLRTKEKK